MINIWPEQSICISLFCALQQQHLAWSSRHTRQFTQFHIQFSTINNIVGPSLVDWVSESLPEKTKNYSRKFQLSFCVCFSFALAVAITALCYFMYIFLQQRAQKGGEKTRRIIFVIKIPFCSYSTKNILETLRFFSFIRSIFFLFSPSSLIFLQLLLAANSGSSSAIQTRTQQH